MIFFFLHSRLNGYNLSLYFSQIVCGIIMMVMGSVACIEEKGTVTNLGLGVFAGLATVIASGKSNFLLIHEYSYAS